jgi:hypothetical protein
LLPVAHLALVVVAELQAVIVMVVAEAEQVGLQLELLMAVEAVAEFLVAVAVQPCLLVLAEPVAMDLPVEAVEATGALIPEEQVEGLLLLHPLLQLQWVEQVEAE